MKKLILLFSFFITVSLSGQFTKSFKKIRVDTISGRSDTIWISNEIGSTGYLRVGNDSLYFGDVSGEYSLKSLISAVDLTAYFDTVYNKQNYITVVKDAGTTQRFTSIATAVAAMVENDIIYIHKGEYTISANLEFPDSIGIKFDEGAIIHNTNTTDTIIFGDNTYMYAPIMQIFDTNQVISNPPTVSMAYPQWFGAKGDYVYGVGGTNDIEALRSVFQFSKVDLLDKIYYTYGTMKIYHDLTIYANGAKIVNDNDIDGQVILTVSGSIDDYVYLDYPITELRNFIVSPTLAAQLKNGDLVKVHSTQPLNTYMHEYQSSYGRGEMKVVRNVVDSFIYFNEGFFVSYDTGKWYNYYAVDSIDCSVCAAKVNPIEFSIIGNLTLEGLSNNYSDSITTGLRLYYVWNSDINITIKDIGDQAIRLFHNYKVNLNAHIDNIPRSLNIASDGSPGYGIELLGTCIEVVVSGQVSGCRHCIVFNCLDGQSHNVTVTNFKGYGVRDNAVIDIHANQGTVFIKNSELYGGEMIRNETSWGVGYNPLTETTFGKADGIETGARKTYISNVDFHDIQFAVTTRQAHECDIISMTNIRGHGGYSCFYLRDSTTCPWGSRINNLVMDGIYGFAAIPGLDNKSTYHGSIFSVSNGSFLTCQGGVNGNGYCQNAFFRNITCDGQNGTTHFSIRNMDKVQFEGVVMANCTNAFGVIDVRGTDNLNFLNCTFNNVSTMVEVTDAAGSVGALSTYDTVIKTVKFINCDILTNGSTARGLLNMPSYTKIGHLMVDGTTIRGGIRYWISKGTNAGADYVTVGTNEEHEDFVRMIMYQTYINLYIFNGSPTNPIKSAGYGAPTHTTYYPGAIYTRLDGGTGTTLYIREDTTWVAK